MCWAARLLAGLMMAGLCGEADAEVLVRWDQDQLPSPQSLGIAAVVIPSDRAAAIRNALAQGYLVHLEIDAAALPAFKVPEGTAGAFVKGSVPDDQLARLKRQFTSPAARVRVLEERGKWPHIRTNWVTRNKDVLQVTSRSSQPWIENNAALIRLASAGGGEAPLLSYPWKPVTVSDIDQGPRLEHYLVAIAEAGSFGADLLLPLHERFQRSLVLGRPEARADWSEIRRYLEFYSWNLPQRYRALANIGVVTSDAMRSFELMNLLVRHNLPFTAIEPAGLASRELTGLDLLIVLDGPPGAAAGPAAEFARGGGTVLWAAGGTPGSGSGGLPWRNEQAAVRSPGRVTYPVGGGRIIELAAPPGDPNTFALEMRQVLGPERRLIDIWNGITVLTAAYGEPAGGRVLVSALNYAAQPLPVQVRVRGTFSEVHYESPGEPAALLPFQHRSGYTEFVLPALGLGGRVFLTPIP